MSTFADKIKTQWSKLDVLVNNAGYFKSGQLLKEADGILEKMIETNLYGHYHLTRSLSPLILRHRSGYIFNICSTASIIPFNNGGSYSISKYGFLGFSKVLREELKPHNIRVSAILPGATLTDSWKDFGLPEDRFINPNDIASIIVHADKLNPQTVVEEILVRPVKGDVN